MKVTHNFPMLKKRHLYVTPAHGQALGKAGRDTGAFHSLAHGLRCRELSGGIFIKPKEIWDIFVSKDDFVS